MFGYKRCKTIAEEKLKLKISRRRNNWYVPAALQDETISPIVGQVGLSDVNGSCFLLAERGGQGIAIKPQEGVVYAPVELK